MISFHYLNSFHYLCAIIQNVVFDSCLSICISGMKYCSHCGHPNQDEDLFCSNCGKPLSPSKPNNGTGKRSNRSSRKKGGESWIDSLNEYECCSLTCSNRTRQKRRRRSSSAGQRRRRLIPPACLRTGPTLGCIAGCC